MIPGGQYTPQPPLSAAQMKAVSQFLLDSIIGSIAIALGGIDIAGWKPLDFLADWGRERIEAAQRNYEAAMNAQGTANRANSQITAIAGLIQASDVPGGVSVGDQFTGFAADNLGPGFTLTIADGPGGGRFGLNGVGQARWAKSGGTWRRNMYTANTAMATDYHTIYTVISARGQDTQALGDPALVYLTGRGDATGKTFIWLAIHWNRFEIGGCTNGTFTSWWSMDATINAGDQVALICGGASVNTLYVKRNGIVTPATVNGWYGPDRRHVGVGAKATPRNVLTDQTTPAQLDMWSACDRQPTTL